MGLRWGECGAAVMSPGCGSHTLATGGYGGLCGVGGDPDKSVFYSPLPLPGKPTATTSLLCAAYFYISHLSFSLFISLVCFWFCPIFLLLLIISFSLKLPLHFFIFFCTLQSAFWSLTAGLCLFRLRGGGGAAAAAAVCVSVCWPHSSLLCSALVCSAAVGWEQRCRGASVLLPAVG